jgi:hypothetical protein
MATDREFVRLRRQCSSGLRRLRESAGHAERELENLHLSASGKARAAVPAKLQQTVQAGQAYLGACRRMARLLQQHGEREAKNP